MALAKVPTIQKQDQSKFKHFCPDFKWFLTKWLTFIRISNCWASRFQIPFEIQTIRNLTSFLPFKIQTLSVSWTVAFKWTEAVVFKNNILFCLLNFSFINWHNQRLFFKLFLFEFLLFVFCVDIDVFSVGGSVGSNAFFARFDANQILDPGPTFRLQDCFPFFFSTFDLKKTKILIKNSQPPIDSKHLCR